MKYWLLVLMTVIFSQGRSQTISLNGPWSFAIDLQSQGELLGWNKPGGQNNLRKNEDPSTFVAGLDIVHVPHTWSLDMRYQHIGQSWNRKSFKLPAEVKYKTVRLCFDGVFYKCRIFLNGDLIAYHYGGYTPFSIYISQGHTNLAPYNFIGDIVTEILPDFEKVTGTSTYNGWSAEYYNDAHKLNMVQNEPNITLLTEQRVIGVDAPNGIIKAVIAQHIRTARQIRVEAMIKSLNSVEMTDPGATVVKQHDSMIA